MVTRLFIAFVVCSVVAGVTAQSVDPNRIRTRTGPPLVDTHAEWQILSTGAWWVRVNADATEARAITWRFGKTEADMTPKVPEPSHSLFWNRGTKINPELGNQDRRLYPGNMTVWLWEYLRPEETIYLSAKAEPPTARASFCVFYQQQGVALIQFRNEIDKPLQVTRAEHATLCQP